MNKILLGPKWPKIPRRNAYTAFSELVSIRDTTGLSWRQIAALDQYKEIPAATLQHWYKTGDPEQYPQKWKKELGIVDDFRYRRACNMIDIESCADTLEGYMHEININKLIDELERRGYGTNGSGHRDGQVG